MANLDEEYRRELFRCSRFDHPSSGPRWDHFRLCVSQEALEDGSGFNITVEKFIGWKDGKEQWGNWVVTTEELKYVSEQYISQCAGKPQ